MILEFVNKNITTNSYEYKVIYFMRHDEEESFIEPARAEVTFQINMLIVRELYFELPEDKYIKSVIAGRLIK